MIINYYKDENLRYASRKRGRVDTPTPFAIETYNSYVLGNGAYTSVVTSSDNVCDYVIFNLDSGENQRWFVVDFVYLNGAQVQLNLRRDVLGEFGIRNMFGKIERGYTDSILKYRKELNLNQVLGKRIPLISNEFTYGNYSIDTHNNEKWGILYLTTQGDSAEKITIPIPGFTPNYVNYDLINNGTEYIINVKYNCSFEFFMLIQNMLGSFTSYLCKIKIFPNGNSLSYSVGAYIVEEGKQSGSFGDQPQITNYLIIQPKSPGGSTDSSVAKDVLEHIANNMIFGNYNAFIAPAVFQESSNAPTVDYNNVYIKTDNEVRLYNVEDVPLYSAGRAWTKYDSISQSSYIEDNIIFDIGNWNKYNVSQSNFMCYADVGSFAEKDKYTYSIVDLAGSGEIVIDLSKTQVAEPYYIIVTPLFDTKIKDRNGNVLYNISQDNAFSVFNKTIRQLSGNSTYLVDAQIYPYCPQLSSIVTDLIDNQSSYKHPFFSIISNTYDVDCNIQLYPYSDIKKEYIKNEYTILAPDRSNRFTFNFYDYVGAVNDNNGVNYSNIQIKIKTCLKPFSILSFAVPISKDSLLNSNYISDIRGCSPSSNGFECSLASNAFESYKRQNSNYQQIFDLNRQELEKQQAVERVNEGVSIAVNTVTAIEMGAVAGGKIGGKIGAAVGGIASGAVVGTAMGLQYSKNEELREYEKQLQLDRFNLDIGTIKNLPNAVNRISSFNEIIMSEFYYVLECYSCTDDESIFVDSFLDKYGYGIGIYSFFNNFIKNGWFIRGALKSSDLPMNLHYIAEEELLSGVYYYE